MSNDRARLRHRRKMQRWERLFGALCRYAAAGTVLVLVILMVELIRQGAARLSWQFVDSFPSYRPEQAGCKSALWGTVWVMSLTALISVPLGVAAAVYLEELADKTRWNQIVEVNINNLAGVPAIVYGMLGLALFVRGLHLGRSVLAGALTLSLLSLPVIIIAAREALRAVPPRLRTASLALGATRWQTVWRVVLPAALPGIATGVILALSRAVGEAAPLIMLGALSFVARTPQNLMSSFSALPIQIYNWASRPKEEFHQLAAAAILVLLILLLAMNALAVIIRQRAEKNARW